MHDKRPSNRELFKRINEAKEFLKNQQGLFANPSKAVGELSDLEIGNTNDVWQLITELLEEISPKDYRGARPPQKSYEKESQDLSCWLSVGGALNLQNRCTSSLF